MSVDKSLLKLKERIDLELKNSNPEKKGCFCTLAFEKDDPACLNCHDYSECAECSSRNRMSHLEVIENELAKIDEKYAIEKYSYADDEVVAGFDWTRAIIEFTKLKPAYFNTAVDAYFSYLKKDESIDIHGKHKILATRAELYVSRILNGLEEHGYLVWDVKNENKILWIK